MGKVLVDVTMSLDGFIAGPDDAMDWVFEYHGSGIADPDAPNTANAAVEEVIASTGAVLAGRRSYDVGKRALRPETSEVMGGRWTGPQFVLTHHSPAEEEDPTITFLSGDIHQAVATALQAAEGKDVLVIGGNVARQCLAAGLVDDIVIHLAPVLLGSGVRLFDISGSDPNRSGDGQRHAGRTDYESPLPGGEVMRRSMSRLRGEEHRHTPAGPLRHGRRA